MYEIKTVKDNLKIKEHILIFYISPFNLLEKRLGRDY